MFCTKFAIIVLKFVDIKMDEPLDGQDGYKFLREMNVQETVALDASRQNKEYGYHGARE